jgi:adenylate cyclase
VPDEREKRLARLRDKAVRADSHPAALRAARWVRSRLPGDSRFGDALSTAGYDGPQLIGRRVSELQPGRASAAHELGLGALQLWQGLSEASGRGRGNADVTLLFADLAGFSTWALNAGDDACLELLRRVGADTDAAIRSHRGTTVKRLGDGVMATFETVEQATEAAVDLRERLNRIEVDGYQPRMRFGIHCGRPRKLGGDYYGVDVNTAARIMEAADPDEVLLSQSASEALSGERFRLGRARRLKARGTPDDLRVVAVEAAASGTSAGAVGTTRHRRRSP